MARPDRAARKAIQARRAHPANCRSRSTGGRTRFAMPAMSSSSTAALGRQRRIPASARRQGLGLPRQRWPQCAHTASARHLRSRGDLCRARYRRAERELVHCAPRQPRPCPGDGWQVMTQGKRGVAGERGAQGERGSKGDPGTKAHDHQGMEARSRALRRHAGHVGRQLGPIARAARAVRAVPR